MKPRLELIIVAGSPGSGKSTLCRELWTRWNVVPMIDFGDLRNFHLDPAWSNQSDEEITIAFDHLVYIVHSYARHKWGPVLVTDLTEQWLARTEECFGDLTYVIVTLYTSDEIVAERIVTRNSGFKNVAAAVDWNRSIRERGLLPNEIRVDNSNSVIETANAVELALKHR